MDTDESEATSPLHDRWMSLTANIEKGISEKWWDILKSKYTDPSRKYHTFSHLQNMFNHMDSHINEIQHKDAMSYAIFFHDLEYDIHSQENEEESIKHFKQFSEDSKLIQDHKLMEVVEALIMASKAHCTEEHKQEGMFGTEDMHYFLDFDVSILGAESADYKKYASQIAEEYAFLPSSKYKFMRSKLQNVSKKTFLNSDWAASNLNPQGRKQQLLWWKKLRNGIHFPTFLLKYHTKSGQLVVIQCYCGAAVAEMSLHIPVGVATSAGGA